MMTKERIVEVTDENGRLYRVTLRSNGIPRVERIIFGLPSYDPVSTPEHWAAITLAKAVEDK